MSKIFYFFAVFLIAFYLQREYVFNANGRKDEMRTIKSRQVGLNKTLAELRKIVEFKKLTKEPVKIDFYILKGLRFLCDYWNYRYNF